MTPPPDSEHDHRRCQELFARLSEYLDQELDAVTCQDIERHLAECAPCQACFATLRRTVALCREMPAQEVASEDFSLRLRAAIDQLAAELPSSEDPPADT